MKSRNDKCEQQDLVDFLNQIKNAGSLDEIVRLMSKKHRFGQKALEQIEQALTRSAPPYIQNALTAVLFSENFISAKEHNRFLTECVKINGVKNAVEISLFITAIAKDEEGNSAKLLEDVIKIAAQRIGFFIKGNINYNKPNTERIEAARLMRKLARCLNKKAEFVFLNPSEIDLIACKCPACTVKKLVAENPANH